MPTLLVIDDDRACRASVRGAAEEMGWVVLEAADGLSGLDLARRYVNELDLVVLDIHMPQLDGYWTCLRLHELRPARPFLILPFTGVVDAVPFLAELGCAPPLLKPASRERLQEAFQAALRAVPRAPLPVRCCTSRSSMPRTSSRPHGWTTRPCASLCLHPPASLAQAWPS